MNPATIQKKEQDNIGSIARRIACARTKGELGSILAAELADYQIMDLQVIGGWLHSEFRVVPSPYREQVSPYIKDQLFGAYHRLLLYHRTGRFSSMNKQSPTVKHFLLSARCCPKGACGGMNQRRDYRSGSLRVTGLSTISYPHSPCSSLTVPAIRLGCLFRAASELRKKMVYFYVQYVTVKKMSRFQSATFARLPRTKN